MEQKPNFAGRVNPIQLEQPKTYHLPDWDGYNDPKKLAMLRQIVLQYGRDPRIAEKTVEILRQSDCKPREYKKQAAALLEWVQKNIYYVNEPVERLQSPMYTLKSGLGDCDDLAILLCAFFESIRLPWKFVISGNDRNGLIRYHEGDKEYRRIPYSHIYCMVGNKPFTPTEWFYCEPTMSVPMGWDIVQTQHNPNARKYLPELGALISPSTAIASGVVGTSVEANETFNMKKFSKEIFVGVLAGSLTAIVTEIALEYIRTSDWYKTFFKDRKAKE